MKKILKSFLCLFVCVVCVLGMSCNARAMEVEGLNKVQFFFADRTNGEFTGEITISLLSTDNSAAYDFVYDKEMWNYGGVDYGYGFIQYVAANKQYNVGLLFDKKNSETSGYTLTQADGSPFTSFTADEDMKVFKLVLTKTSSAATTTSSSSPNSSGSYAGNADDAEGDRLWNDFVSAVSVAKNNEQFDTLFVFYDYSDAKYYEQTTNKPQEDYVNMTPYERMLWKSTYIRPANVLTSQDYDYYRGSLENWNAHTVNVEQSIFDEWGTKEMADAYKALMEWQYNYFVKTGAVYNFIEGKNSNDYKVATVTEEEAEQFVQDDLEQAKKDLEGGLTENDTQKVPKKTGGAITVILLLIIAGAAVCAVIVYKKKQNKQ